MRAKQPARQRRGFTFVEIVVVLVVIGVALAVVAPSFILPAPESGLRHVLNGGRRAALRRGQAMTLSLKRDGNWRLDGEHSTTDEPLTKGAMESKDASDAEIRISPIGVCTMQRGHVGAADERLDPFTCSVAPGGSRR